MALLVAFPGTGLFAQDGEGGPPEGVPPVDPGPPEGDPPFGGAPPVSRAGAALLPVEGDCLVEGAGGMAHLISNPAHSFIIVVVRGLEEGVYTATLHRGDEEAVLGTLAGGSAPYCADAADANDDGAVDISDPLVTLTSLFSSSGSLPALSGRQGFDPTPDDLFCRG